MRIIQFNDAARGRCVGVVQDDLVLNVTDQDRTLTSVAAAFREAHRQRLRLADLLGGIAAQASGRRLEYPELLAANRVLPPITEEPGSRLLVTGTGLTHLGSVQQRDAMHKPVEQPDAPKSDSKKMFEMGIAGGRPAPGKRGAAPEWFYKGDGRILRGPGELLDIPAFAPDGGEEPEVVGLYIVDERGVPCRLGFTQGNEWSDHVTENVNYLYLAPSKLRSCAIGPELITGLRFTDIAGRCRVRRAGQVIYDSGELRTGEKNMCHSLANLEDHHFKYPQHRKPGDIHVHFFGTSKLSFQHRQWKYDNGDEIEVAFDGFGAPLRNQVRRQPPSEAPVTVEQG